MTYDPVPANLALIINRQATDAIVRCTGRITSDTTQSLKATVKPLFPESKRVVLDLTDVNYLDSSGLGAIVGLHVSAKFANCQLKLIYSNESLKKLFRITRLDQLLAEGA
jgi:anti-sigma B factor antagonist